MPLEIVQPVFDIALRAHRVTITDFQPPIEYLTSVTKQLELDQVKDEFLVFINEFLEKASKYFSQKIDAPLFIQRISHTFDGEEETGATVRVSWIPAYVLFYPGRYVIHWKLINTEIPPGKPDKEEEAVPVQEAVEPPAEATVVSPVRSTKQMRKKIRQARLKVAVARHYLYRITQRYYERYGDFDGMEDSESELSSESDVE